VLLGQKLNPGYCNRQRCWTDTSRQLPDDWSAHSFLTSHINPPQIWWRCYHVALRTQLLSSLQTQSKYSWWNKSHMVRARKSFHAQWPNKNSVPCHCDKKTGHGVELTKYKKHYATTACDGQRAFWGALPKVASVVKWSPARRRAGSDMLWAGRPQKSGSFPTTKRSVPFTTACRPALRPIQSATQDPRGKVAEAWS
jgi:hypothetical protein